MASTTDTENSCPFGAGTPNERDDHYWILVDESTDGVVAVYRCKFCGKEEVV